MKDEKKYQTEIIAIDCFWRENLDIDLLLQENPIVGNSYFVTINQLNKIELNKEIWLFYNCPSAFYNGYENEEEIELTSFYFGKIDKIISTDDLRVTFIFTISKKKTFLDLLNIKESKELPKFWLDYFLEFINKNEYSLQTIGKYHQLIVSYTFDLGQSCIFTKFENDYFICLMNEWYFKDEIRYGAKYKMPKEIIEYILAHLNIQN